MRTNWLFPNEFVACFTNADCTSIPHGSHHYLEFFIFCGTCVNTDPVYCLLELSVYELLCIRTNLCNLGQVF